MGLELTRIDLRMTRIDPRIDLQIPLPDWSQDDLQIPISQTSDILWSI